MKTTRRCVVRSCRLRAVLIAVAGLLWTGSMEAALQDSERQTGHEPTTSEAAPREPAVDSGFLIVENRYVAPPYQVEHDGEYLRINGLALGMPGAAARYLELNGHAFGPSFRGRRIYHGMLSAPDVDLDARRMLIDVQRLLLSGSLIIAFRDGTVCAFPHGETMIRTLLSDTERTEKLRLLTSHNRQPVTLAQWTSLIDEFQSDPTLAERLRPEENPDEMPVQTLVAPSRYLLYPLTVLGMVLTIVSFGLVLSHRPQHFCRWSDINRIPRDVRLVMGCAAMIAILCVFDVTCTLTAAHTTSFWEINPFGASLASQPAVLLGLKLVATAACVAILWNLRFYRGTQLASWWLCLGLTLLTARWVVFNSLMLA